MSWRERSPRDFARSRSWRDFSRAVSLLFAMSQACHMGAVLAIPQIPRTTRRFSAGTLEVRWRMAEFLCQAILQQVKTEAEANAACGAGLSPWLLS